MFFPLETLKGGDLIAFHYPYLNALRAGAGETLFPFWFPEVFAGGPGIPDIGTTLMSPLNLLLLVADAATTLKMQVFIYLLIMAVGMRRWARLWTESDVWATLAAVLMLASFQTRGLLAYGHLVILSSMALLPWMLYALHRLSQAEQIRERFAWTSFLGLIYTGLWLAGHPQMIMIFSELLGLYGIWLWRRCRPTGALLLPVAILLGCAGALPQLAATLEWIEWSGREISRHDDGFLFSGSLHPLSALKWASPFSFGPPTGYFGQGDFWFGQLFSTGLGALFVVSGWRATPLGLRMLLLLGLVMSLGSWTPLYRLHQFLVPGADLFRYPARYLYAVAPIIALLTALGVARWWKSPPSKKCILAGTFFLLIPVLIMLLSHAGWPISLGDEKISPGWFVLLVAEAGIWLMLTHGRWKLAGFVLLGLIQVVAHWNLPLPSHRWPKVGNAIVHSGAPPTRTVVLMNGSLHNHDLVAMRHGLGGYADLIPAHYRQFLDALAPQDFRKQTRVQFEHLGQDALAYLNVDSVYERLDVSHQPVERVIQLPGHRQRFFWGEPGVPLAFEGNEASAQAVASQQARLFASFTDTFGRSPRKDTSGDTLLLTSYAREDLRLEVQCSGPSILASTENHAPFWRASIDGERVKIHPWLGTFKSVFVPEGRHKVHFYVDREPFEQRLGIALSAIFLMLVTALWGLLVPRKGERIA